MSELPGAVARSQLKKVEATVERRRARAAQLTQILDDVDGVSASTVPAGINPSYWLYMLHVEEQAGVDTKTFGDALVAVGVPAWVRYIVDPVYMSPMFTDRKIYGTSAYLFSQYRYQAFERGLCPQAEAALSGVIAIHWNENYTSEHAKQIGMAIRKVVHHFSPVEAGR